MRIPAVVSLGLGGPVAALTLVAAALVTHPAQAARYVEYRGYVPGEVIVKYRAEADAQIAKAARQQLGLTVRRTLARGRVQVLALPSVTDVERLIPVLAADPAVEFVEPNFIRERRIALPNDPLFTDQWGLHSTGQANFATDDPELASIVGADMNLPAAWDTDGDGDADRTGDGSVVVAIIDDAIDTTHPDFAANIVPGADLAANDNNPNPDNAALDHGTLVTGALGAIGNNGVGIAGIAWNVKLMPLKVGRISGDSAVLDTASILEAYQYAEDHGARIVNASYGGPDFSQAELDAIGSLEQAGVLFVTSAGNFNSNLDYSVAAYPANYDVANVVAVAASNRQDNVASFSQYGPLSTDVAAPGLQIVTTSVGGGYTAPNNCPDTGSCGVNGTSFASPHTAGVAALVAMTHPAATYREIKARLIEGAEDGVDDGDAGELTVGGRVDAANSLDLDPRPSLILRSVRLVDDGNERLDPGESLTVEVVVENLWQPATAVQAQLTAPGAPITVTGNPAPIPTLQAGQSATLSFPIEVGAADTAYRDVDFVVDLTANLGTYAARRHFRQELAELDVAQVVTAQLSTGLHDEFHTYHLDLPSVPAGNRLVVCTRADADIDVLVKAGAPAQYDIDLGAPPEDEPTFFTDADKIGGDESGNERVVFESPVAGTYYVTVLNYALEDALGYTLEAFLAPASTAAVGEICSVEARRGGGGGLSPVALMMLALLALGRSLQICAKARLETGRSRASS